MNNSEKQLPKRLRRIIANICVQTWAHAVENFRIYQYYLEGAENIQHNFSKISTTFYLSDSDFSNFRTFKTIDF